LRDPERKAYTFLTDGEREEAHLTFAELDRQARAIASLLQVAQADGQPVLLLYQPGLEYLAAFFGCLYAGAIAVPAYPPRLNHNLERLEAIVADAQPILALSTKNVATAAMRKQFTTSFHLSNLHIEVTDALGEGLAEQWHEPALSGEALAFLQYTSGSTGKPKGVMVSHQNLLYNHRMLQEALQHPEDAPVVGWLPLFHDMGLIGNALQAIYNGAPYIFMSPFAFLQKPFRWLDAISRYKAYSSFAPNFAYDLCVQKITPEQRATLDLSQWHNAVSGAEPIRGETLESFVRTFAPCGFRHETFFPGYGLAEATLMVSCARAGRQNDIQTVLANELERHKVVATDQEEKRSRNIVNCGHTWLEQKIVIVDPETHVVCPPDQVGEIWISGLNVAQGYWKNLEATRETFQAQLAGSAEGPFMRTGDMGFLDHGDLFVTGRLKDLIIIRGQNYYPQDIEKVAEQSHPALRQNNSAAFSLEIAGEERVLLVQEIERQHRHQEPKDVFSAIREAVFGELELHLDGIVLIKPGSIPKTSSGKIQHRACREALLTQSLSIVFADLPKSVADLIAQSSAKQTENVPVAQTVQSMSAESRFEVSNGSAQQFDLSHAQTGARDLKAMQFSLLYFASDEAALIENKYELFLEGAKFADQHDFTAVWIPERHFHPFGGLYPNPSVLAAALAVMTRQIRIRAGSVVLPMHHPARVTEEWSVIDNLSSGRVDIAFATGWNPNDFVLSPENYANRKELLFSGIDTFTQLWGGHAITLPNGLGRQTAIKIYPQPRQRELIPWITCTGNPERFVEAGVMGANVLTGLLFQSVEELAEKIKLYREARVRHGHDPDGGHVTLMLHTFVDEDLDEVRRKVRVPFTAYLESSVDLWRHGQEKLDGLTPEEREQVLSYAFERYFQTHALFGTPQSCEKMVERLKEVGVDEIASLIDFGMDVDTVMDGLHWLNVLRKRCQKKSKSRRAEVAETVRSNRADQRAVSVQPVEKKQNQLQDYLRQQIALVLERSVDDLADITNTRSLGLDSLKVMSIVNNCQRDLQVVLDAGQFYELTSFESLTQYVTEEYNRVHANGASGKPTVQFSVQRQDRQVSFPQSFAQRRMWFLSQLRPDTVAYNVPTAIRLSGRISVDALRWSLEEIVRRHEILRTTFDMRQGEPVQIINATTTFALSVVNLGSFNLQEREGELQKRAIEEAQRPFDLLHGPLIRGTLLLLDANEAMLLLTYHHIVADGWSRGILVRELQTLYTSFITGRPSTLEALPIQYADFTVWQREWLQRPVTSNRQSIGDGQEQTLLASQITYWKEQLDGPLPALELPLDHPRPPLQTFHGAHQTISIPEQVMEKLKALSEREGASLFMTLLASFQVLLARHSGQKDILVGSPIAGRTRAEAEALIGFFVNMLALRTDLSGNPSFQEVLQRVRRVCLAAYAHQEVPFEQVVEAVAPARDLSRSPIFQVVFVLNEASWWLEGEAAGLHLHQVEMESGISAFDLTWSVTTRGFGVVEYNTDLFEKETISRLLAHWYELLYAIVADPLQRLTDLSLLTAEEQKQILVNWNATQHAYSRTLSLHRLFEEHANRSPGAIAIKTPTVELSYQDVERRSNQVARALCRQGIGIGARVGICMNRVPEAIIGMLGILKAGGVYVPLDPHYPQERLRFMIEDSQISLLITRKNGHDDLPGQELPILYLDAAWFQETSESPAPLVQDVTPDNLAYIIYTSGSTGQPKGVQVSHRGIQNLVEVQKQNFALQPEDRILQFSSMSFDASIWEICMSLCTGATLCLEAENIVLAGSALKEAIEKLAITVITLPPSVLASLATEHLPQLRTIIVAGEACPLELVTHWAGGRRFFNAYGPTEATVCATMEQCTEDARSISIGRPITNMQIYLLDTAMRPVPIGVPGEMYIGGVGLADGYFNRPELTAERFVPHPFTEQKGARLYRTGDRGRLHADGTIEFLGRVDNQVKIHGHRIELGEIEAVLLQYPAVQDCVVVVQDALREDKRLVGYVVLQVGSLFSSEDIRGYMRQRLPEYMVPAIVLPLERIPLTPNGKIDRKGLPEAKIAREQEATRILPSNASEQVIADIWQEYLHLEKIGRHENFFDLGGHSLLVVQVHQRLRDHFQKDIELTDLFKYPTVSDFARYLDQTDQQTQLMREQANALREHQEEALRAGKSRLQRMRLSTSERVKQ
jgi:natural product biosynthesis luciferase-like monooxygenase protein/amino acid adenylation domain-containing protein